MDTGHTFAAEPAAQELSALGRVQRALARTRDGDEDEEGEEHDVLLPGAPGDGLQADGTDGGGDEAAGGVGGKLGFGKLMEMLPGRSKGREYSELPAGQL